MGPETEEQCYCGIPSCDFRGNRSELDEHLRKQHRDVSDYFCKTCWTRFARLSAYVDHIKYDVCKIRSGSAICGALGCTHKSDLKDLKQHVLSQHHELNKFICKTCFVGFDHHIKFLSHAASMVCWEKVLAEATHNAQRQQSGLSLLCPVAGCPFVARKSQELIDHGDGAHPDSKRYECKRCNRAFDDMTSTICHYLETECCRAGRFDDVEENGTTNVACGVADCDQVVPNGSLVRHILVSHPGSSAFLCKRCNRNFTAVTSFVTHAKTCDAELRKSAAARSEVGFQPRYRCFYCKARFDDYEEFEFHHGEAHPKKERTVQLWSIGSSKYTRRSGVNVKEVENDHVCSICAAQMANTETLMRHILIIHRQHCCPRCGAMFPNAEELAWHRTDVHGKFEETKAEKEREAKRRERIASGIHDEGGLEGSQTGKQHECYLCSLVFETKTSLQKHALLRHRVYVCFHCEYVASGATALNDFRVHHVLRHLSDGPIRHPDVEECPSPKARGETPSRSVLQVGTHGDDATANENSTPFQDHDRSNSSATVAQENDSAEHTWWQSKGRRRSALRRSALRILSSSDESEGPSHRCERCRMRFVTRNDLHRHMARLHRLRYFCDYCNAGTTQKQQLSCHHVRNHAAQAFKYVTLQGDTLVEREEFPSPLSIERSLRIDEGMLSSSGSEQSSDSHSDESEWSPQYLSDDNERNSRRRTRSTKKSKVRIAETTAFASETTDDNADTSARHRRRSKRVSDRDAALRSARIAVGQPGEELGTASGDEDVGEDLDEEPLPKNEDDRFFSALDTVKLKDALYGRSEVSCSRYADTESTKNALGERGENPVRRKRSHESPVTPARNRKSPRRDMVTIKQEPEAEEMQVVPVKREPVEWNGLKECSKAAGEPERLSISRAFYKVYGGYRVPKTAGAFRKLLQNIGDVYKCCEFACSFSTTSPQRFEAHLQRHDANHLFCIYCGVAIADASRLLSHLDGEHGCSVNQCTKCLYRASTQRHIECHFAHAHPNESSSYVTISTTSGTRSEAMALLESSKPYCCGFETCGFSTMKTSELFRHLRSNHPNELSYPCPLCSETRDDIEDLVSHFPEHGVNNVQCAYCSHCSVTIGGIILHLCYCHADRVIKFYFRSSDLEEEFIKVLKSSEYILPHYFVDLVREKTPMLSADLDHIEFQQRCSFCTVWCGGFKAFRTHVLSEHKPAVRSEELAESLFGNYDFRTAVREGRCPFCSHIAETTKELQEHVLDEELVYAPYECHLCMQTFGTERELDEHLFDRHVDEQKLVFHNPDAQLLAWVRSNIIVGASVQDGASVALRGPDADGEEDAGGILQVTSVYSTRSDATDVLRGEGSVSGEHRCGRCGLTTFSETYYRKHLQTCEGKPPEEPPKPIREVDAAKFTCTICSADFAIMQTFARHGRDEHDLHYFCSVCFRGSRTKTALRDHLEIYHRGDAKAYVIDDGAKKGQRRSTDFRLVVCELDGEPNDLEGSPTREEGFSFYGTDYVHVDTKNLTIVKDGVRTGVRTIMRAGSYEPYIMLKDLKQLWC